MTSQTVTLKKYFTLRKMFFWIKLACLCCRKTHIFLRLVLHNLRKQKKGCGFPFAQKVENQQWPECTGPINTPSGGLHTESWAMHVSGSSVFKQQTIWLTAGHKQSCVTAKQSTEKTWFLIDQYCLVLQFNLSLKDTEKGASLYLPSVLALIKMRKYNL